MRRFSFIPTNLSLASISVELDSARQASNQLAAVQMLLALDTLSQQP